MKRLVAKVGEYQSGNDTKGEYVRVGVIGESQNGEYSLLDPTVNLSGVLQKQNAYAISQGRKPSTSVMVSIFEGNNQQQGNNQGGYQQSGNQNRPTSQSQQNGQQNKPAGEPDFDFSDDIPFAPIGLQFPNLLNCI